MKKQSPVDRLKRLQRGACPVHGLWMSQVGLNGSEHCSECGTPKKLEVIVGCPRKDCDITAFTLTIDGPWRLPKELEYLLKTNN